jgi:hypothetical protein
VTDWRERPLDDLLASAGLQDAIERDFPTDGWSGATFSRLEHPDGRRFVLKRTSLDRDWIARATHDIGLREAWLAAHGGEALDPDADGAAPTGTADSRASTAYLGAATDGDGVAAMLMPDLSGELIEWERPGSGPAMDGSALARVIEAVAGLHAQPWAPTLERRAADDGRDPPPWCPLPERLILLTRPRAAAYAREGNPVGPRFLAGWDAFDRQASPTARALIEDLAADVTPLVRALGRLPSAGLHGDLKLANVALRGPMGVSFIDWQMTLRAPVAVDLGWFLVSNSGSLPTTPEVVLDIYRRAGSAVDLGDWDAQVDLAMLVGLLLRGWRKGLDAEAGAVLPSGVTAIVDLAWWCERAVEAAARRL